MALPATDDIQPLAVYVHWPFCLSKCPYCDFNSHVRESVDHAAWRDALVAEIAHYAAILPNRRVESVFFGGGTPSLMQPDTVAAVLDAVARHWPLSSDIEITLEANPTSSEVEKFRAFAAAGVNRVSLGVQALEEDVLRFLGRTHSAAHALNAVEMAAMHFPRYSFDLIYARPGQTVTAWERELRAALRHAGDHLSLYQLTIEPGTHFFHAHARGEFKEIDEDTAAELYLATQAIMESAGMPAYETSNHARPGQESRHNLAYWRYQDYVGIGPGAHGRITLGAPLARSLLNLSGSQAAFASVPCEREKVLLETDRPVKFATQGWRSPEKWLQHVQQHRHGREAGVAVSQQEQLEERVMMGLRLREGISPSAFLASTGRNLFDVLNRQGVAQLQQAGWLEVTPERVTVTGNGRLLLNSVLEKLLVA